MKLELICWNCGATLEAQPMTLETEEPTLGLRVVECLCHAKTIRCLMDERTVLKSQLVKKHAEVLELSDQVVQLIEERAKLQGESEVGMRLLGAMYW